MGKINILDSKIYNRIAAGEVVESPRSVVKELVENSIDAGATQISVIIEEGGIKSISVIDNGIGMSEDDVKKAFLPHATSKISSISDLDKISTLGFRGEALCSIASVAEVKLTSRQNGGELGSFICLDNGEVVNEGVIGAPLGTSVIVTNLFEKIPARKKFLRKSKTEKNEISSLMARLILANSNISFKYIVDNKIIYQSSGQGIKDAIYTVYGYETFDNLIEINAQSAGLKIYGYISKLNYSKYNRSYQTLIVNGRYVINQDISFVVYNCYKDYLVARQYPMYILYIDLPYDMVDVNVHPNKLDVKFVQLNKISALLKEAINDSLYGVAASISIDNLPLSIKNEKSNFNNEKSDIIDIKPKSLDSIFLKNSNNLEYNYDDIQPSKEKLPNYESSNSFFNSITPKFLSESSKLSYLILNDDENLKEEQSKHQILETKNQINTLQTSFLKEKEFRRVGKLFNTYILIEIGNTVYIIDQHAAHERLIFDELFDKANNKSINIQNLLVPYIFSLSHEDSALLDEHLDKLEECGFLMQKLSGYNYSLGGVPLIATGFDEASFINNLFEMLHSKNISGAELIKDKIIMSACKAAIKGNQDLSELEIDSLLDKLADSEILYCPHGRPVIIKLGKAEIEKWFKRR